MKNKLIANKKVLHLILWFLVMIMYIQFLCISTFSYIISLMYSYPGNDFEDITTLEWLFAVTNLEHIIAYLLLITLILSLWGILTTRKIGFQLLKWVIYLSVIATVILIVFQDYSNRLPEVNLYGTFFLTLLFFYTLYLNQISTD